MLDLLKEIYTHRNLTFSRRFLPFTLMLVAGVALSLFNQAWWFSGEVFPSLMMLAWAVFLAGLFGSATWLLPFEAAQLKKIHQHIAQIDWLGAQHSLYKKHALISPAYGIQKDLSQVSLFKQKGLMLEAHEALKPFP
ncbi:MAG: hypothetical protein ACXWT1_22520, partial [Methylobacter sp.]